eukprot:gene10020-biopygen10791
MGLGIQLFSWGWHAGREQVCAGVGVAEKCLPPAWGGRSPLKALLASASGVPRTRIRPGVVRANRAIHGKGGGKGDLGDRADPSNHSDLGAHVHCDLPAATYNTAGLTPSGRSQWTWAPLLYWYQAPSLGRGVGIGYPCRGACTLQRFWALSSHWADDRAYVGAGVVEMEWSAAPLTSWAQPGGWSGRLRWAPSWGWASLSGWASLVGESILAGESVLARSSMTDYCTAASTTDHCTNNNCTDNNCTNNNCTDNN